MSIVINPHEERTIQLVRLVFARWSYRAEMSVAISGDTKGLDVIEEAVLRAPGYLRDAESGNTFLVMTSPAGVAVRCDDDGTDYWLREMLILAEITAIEPAQGGDDGH